MLQHILNPAFLHSFEKGEGEQLLGPPNPEGDNPDSITSVFITKVNMLTDILLNSFTLSCLLFYFSLLSSFILSTLLECVSCCFFSVIRLTIYILCHYQLHPIQSELSSPISAVHCIVTYSNCQLQLISPSFLHLQSVFVFHSLPPSLWSLFPSHFIHQIRL